MKAINDLIIFILVLAFITGLGYIAINYNFDKFEAFCRNNPDMQQCKTFPEVKSL